MDNLCMRFGVQDDLAKLVFFFCADIDMGDI